MRNVKSDSLTVRAAHVMDCIILSDDILQPPAAGIDGVVAATRYKSSLKENQVQ